LFQGVELHLGIDEGGAEMAMAEHVRNGLQGMTLMEHSGGEAVPKGMCTIARGVNTRSSDVPIYDGRK
jgi:hypothetical protein